jgi:molybdate transport system substrate-binding protein
MYARDSLTALGLWEAVSPRLAPAANARAALLQVERGLATVGILYASDVAGSHRAVIVAEMPPHSYGPIQYLAATVGDSAGRPGIDEILNFLDRPEAAQIFRRHGFTPPD